MKKIPLFLFFSLFVCVLFAQNKEANLPFSDIEWAGNVGAKKFPSGKKIFNAKAFGAVGDALVNSTQAIQSAIDECAKQGGGVVTFEPGIFLTGSLFIKENVNFNVPKGTTLIGSQNIDDYRRIETRVAGLEMIWPAALINIVDCENSAITGSGVINGRGKPFWEKYWSMRKEYDPKGLRWCVDYDCERPRGILVSNSRNITIKDIVLYQTGFWAMHLLYSNAVTVDGVIISNNIEGRGPSTDGIDIDSSERVLIQNSYINCNDDNFCLKAGRDADGLRVNRPCQYIVIRDCIAGHGDGLFTCGSETSGSIRHILAYNLKGLGTKYGLRFKSTRQRGGTIENIYLANIEMVGVRDPFIFDLNWHPAYSTSKLPVEYKGKTLPVHWNKLLEEVPLDKGTPKFKDIYFKNISAIQANTCIQVMGIKESTIDNISLENVSFEGKNAGRVAWAKNWTVNGFSLKHTGNSLKTENTEGVNLK